jgi:hypothetical protein
VPAAGADLGAAGQGVPGGFGPFDRRACAHGGISNRQVSTVKGNEKIIVRVVALFFRSQRVAFPIPILRGVVHIGRKWVVHLRVQIDTCRLLLRYS